MKTQSIQNTNFQGSINVYGLSKKQQKVYAQIEKTLKGQVAPKDYCILHIEGSTSPTYISNEYSKTPKYAIMYTQAKSATKPTAQTYTDSLSPKVWLEKTNKILKEHENSDLYKKISSGEDISTFGKIKDFFNKIITNLRNI